MDIRKLKNRLRKIGKTKDRSLKACLKIGNRKIKIYIYLEKGYRKQVGEYCVRFTENSTDSDTYLVYLDSLEPFIIGYLKNEERDHSKIKYINYRGHKLDNFVYNSSYSRMGVIIEKVLEARGLGELVDLTDGESWPEYYLTYKGVEKYIGVVD